MLTLKAGDFVKMFVLSGLKKVILGEPLTNQMAIHERISKIKALAVLSSDALSSVAYATEEILIPLALIGSMAINWCIPVSISIVILLGIISLSYCQTIDHYPNGGGAYIVAKENLGTLPGLVAAASLLIDYILTVAVSIAAGVQNISAAIPVTEPYKVLIGSTTIFLITLLNLRGVRESASIFALPTYIFIGSFLILIATGFYKMITGQFNQILPPTSFSHYSVIPIFLLLRVFSSGCSALTGIEAISNGIPIFQNPAKKNAKTTLIWMSIILGTLFLSITFLTYSFGVIPKKGETTVSLLGQIIFQKNFFYYLLQGSTACVLILAANTSYADFPRLASLLAKDRYLPRQLASIGDRLVFSNGILGLSFSAVLLLFLFQGETHHLIPLYSIGVFLSFTLSQCGMIFFHFKKKEKGWMRSLFFNTLGALTTFIVFLVTAITKFSMGAWIILLLIPSFVLIFLKIHKHYLSVGRELSLFGKNPHFKLEPIENKVIIPVSGIHLGVIDALRYAISISKDIRACYVETDPNTTERLKGEWKKWAHEIPLVILRSPYRSVVAPLLDYFDELSKTTQGAMITVIIPEFITKKWTYQVLHNHTALLIRTALLFRRGKVITSVRYHLNES